MKVKGFKQLKVKMDKLGKNLSIFSANAMMEEAKLTAKISTENVEDAGLVNFRNLIDSVYVSPIIQTRKGWNIEVGYTSHHAAYEHEGWKSQGMPPIDDIENWVSTKLGIPFPEATYVAFAIAWKLSERGHEGEPFLEMAKDDAEKTYARHMAKRIKMALNKKYKKR